MDQNYVNNLPIVKLSTIERMVENLKKNSDEDLDLNLEFVLTALFPNCWNNIQKEMSRQYTMGFISGTRERASTMNEDSDPDCYYE